jgi:hypothetical protein
MRGIAILFVLAKANCEGLFKYAFTNLRDFSTLTSQRPVLSMACCPSSFSPRSRAARPRVRHRS